MEKEFPSEIYRVPLFLASKSPRRIELLCDMGLSVTLVCGNEIEETYPDHLVAEEIPVYLARKKSEAFDAEIPEEAILITADTIVWLDHQVLGKPADRNQAIEMLKALSGKAHDVFTGVCLHYKGEYSSFSAASKVFFKDLTNSEIVYYVDNFQPYDKAGAYGIQEWIGYIGVERIEGSYFNVMGLPVQLIYKKINQLLVSH